MVVVVIVRDKNTKNINFTLVHERISVERHLIIAVRIYETD